METKRDAHGAHAGMSAAARVPGSDAAIHVAAVQTAAPTAVVSLPGSSEVKRRRCR